MIICEEYDVIQLEYSRYISSLSLNSSMFKEKYIFEVFTFLITWNLYFSIGYIFIFDAFIVNIKR